MLAKLFGFDGKTMTVRKELLAGVTTFLTMAYILAVNPSILSTTGMDSGAIFTTTCISAVIATLVMAFYAKLPFALAPGMGLNAFFAFTICGTMGYSWQFALTAVLIEGLIFILLTITGLRTKIVKSLPKVLRRAISPGIGMFIAFIGLKSAGIIGSSESTFVTMGNLHDPAVLLGIIGIILTSVLLIRHVKGALLIGIVATTLLGIPMGVTHFNGVVATPPSIKPICFQFDWSQVFSFDMLICVFTFLFIDIFDTIGTLLGVCQKAGLEDEDGNIPRLEQAFMADAIGTTVGACLGTSTVTTYVESAAGVNDGGRCGLTAFSAAICFALALFFAPFFLAVPAQATAPALVLVGVMMMSGINKIDFTNYLDAIPAFICIVFMPLTYSISDGIMMSLIAFVLLNMFAGEFKKINLGMYILAILFLLRYAFL